MIFKYALALHRHVNKDELGQLYSCQCKTLRKTLPAY